MAQFSVRFSVLAALLGGCANIEAPKWVSSELDTGEATTSSEGNPLDTAAPTDTATTPTTPPCLTAEWVTVETSFPWDGIALPQFKITSACKVDVVIPLIDVSMTGGEWLTTVDPNELEAQTHTRFLGYFPLLSSECSEGTCDRRWKVDLIEVGQIVIPPGGEEIICFAIAGLRQRSAALETALQDDEADGYVLSPIVEYTMDGGEYSLVVEPRPITIVGPS